MLTVTTRVVICTGQDRYSTGTSVIFSNIFFKYRTGVVQTFVYLYNTCIQTKNTSVVQVLCLGQNLGQNLGSKFGQKYRWNGALKLSLICRRYNIIIILIPSKSTDTLQPNDRGAYGGFKGDYGPRLRRFKKDNQRIPDRNEFPPKM